MYFEIAVGAIIVGTYVYHRWIEDHPHPTPVTVGAPRVDEGAPIPLVYGNCRVRSPILAWAGSQRSIEIFDSDENGRLAYFVDMLYVVGIPFYGGGATLVGVYSGDVFLPLNSASSYPFVGSDTDGLVHSLPMWTRLGIAADRQNYWVNNFPARVFRNDLNIVVNIGFVEFHSGTPTQQISDQFSGLGAGIDDLDIDSLTDTQGVLEARPMNSMYVSLNEDASEFVLYPGLPQNILPSNQPSYRNQALACLYHWCNGDRTQLNNYGFGIRSLSVGTPAFLGQSMTDDADPAAVILDLLTSSWGKLALPVSMVDIPSFQAASLALFNEQHGYSRAIETITEATEAIGDVCRQTDGVIYQEPTTGKIVYRLVRNDYDVLQLDNINPSNARPTEGSWISVQGQAETLNQVRVTFTDRENNYTEGLALAQDFANIISQGNKLRSIDLRFPGCCTRILASQIASRELAAVSRPVIKASVITTREFYLKRPGDVVTFTWPQLGISGMVMRIARVDLGTLRDGAIRLDLIRDIFDVSNGAFPVAT